MSKRLTHDLTYDAPSAQVSAMLRDPAFREEVCTYQRVLSVDVDITETDGVTHVVIDQVQQAKGLPSIATKIVGDTINIVQEETWATPDRGAIGVSIPGKPGDINGTATLVETDGRTTETVVFDVKVGIPLVGGKLEALVVDMLTRALEAENTVGRRYLSR